MSDTYYDAFGNVAYGDTPNPFGYSGEYLNNETGLIYLRNRYYDISTGRFITEDTAKDGTNWYSYCAGDPVMLVDPWGLAPKISGGATYTINGINYHIAEGMSADLDEVDFSVMKIYEEIAEDSQSSGFLLNFSHQEQEYSNLCWATSVSIVIKYLSGNDVDKVQIAKDGTKFKDENSLVEIDYNNEVWFNQPMSPTFTSRAINDKKYIEGYIASLKTFKNSEELSSFVKEEITNGRPVLFFDGDHAQVIIGFSDDTFILNDPSPKQNYLNEDELMIPEYEHLDIVYFVPN